LKVGRIKFAVKEIGYKEKMEIDNQSSSKVNGLAANLINDGQDEEFEEYEDVESVIISGPEDDSTNT
jgi:hypothetical protein